jgi:FdhD protein
MALSTSSSRSGPGSGGFATTRVSEWKEGRLRQVDDDLVREEPLEIRLNGAPISVTLRTPGHDEELAAGFLATEGIISRREQIVSIGHVASTSSASASSAAAGSAAANGDNIIDVELSPDVRFDIERLRRHFFTTSSCGICGKASIDAVRVRGLQAPSRGFRVAASVLCRLPDVLRASQALFDRTGGLHAAATFDADGTLRTLREDVGRHNAVDKVVGQALLQGALPLERQVLLVSGRGGFELAQKAVMAGVPVMASVSAPSSLAVQLARELGLTLVGFLRGQRFLVYAGEERID